MSFCYFCEKLDFVWEIKNPKVQSVVGFCVYVFMQSSGTA